MTHWLLITVASLVAAGPVAPVSPGFGVAAQTIDNTICVSGVGKPPPGTRVIVIDPSSPQTWLEGHVGSSPKDCSILAKYDLTEPFIALDPPAERLHPGATFIAVVGSATAKTTDGVVELAMTSSPQQAVRFRVCTSIEGLHLTAWAGQPLKSKRIWHEYVYLGYDVEPSCSEDDFSP
jgi:hypothetical protein